MVKRVLGIDHGDARVGLAVSDELGMLAHALETVEVKKTPDLVGYVAKIATEKDVRHIVIGNPKNMDGTSGTAAQKVKEFAEKLRTQVTCPVTLWDERLTSVAAQKALHQAGRNVKQSREVIDQVAAQMILQSWLDAQSMLM